MNNYYLAKTTLRFALILSLILSTGCYMSSAKPSNIWTAIDKDDGTAIKVLANQGEELNAIGFLNRKTPLEYALEKRKKTAFKALLECGANPDFFLVSKQTVTFECALLGDSFWLKECVDHGADPNLWTRTHPNNSGTPLRATFGYNESAKCVENARLLIDGGADLNGTIGGTENPLSLFAMYSGWKVVLYLLEKGADPHIGPEANLFFTRLQNPSDILSKDPDFLAVVAKLEAINLDVSKAKWNGKTWDIPALRP